MKEDEGVVRNVDPVSDPVRTRKRAPTGPLTYALEPCWWEGRLHCVYLNNYRIAGGKPWGGGDIRQRWKITFKDIANAVPVVTELLTVVKRSAETFRMYEELHTAKGTPEALVKAMSNRLVAEACEAVIAKATGDA